MVGMKSSSELFKMGKARDEKTCILRSTTAETMYEIWRYRNYIRYEITMNNINIGIIVIDTLAIEIGLIQKLESITLILWWIDVDF